MLIDWLEQRLEYTQRKRLRKLISNLIEIVYVNALFVFIMLIMLLPFIILFLSGDHPAAPIGNCYLPQDGCQWLSFISLTNTTSACSANVVMTARSVCRSCWSVYGLTQRLTKSLIRPDAQCVDARVTKSLGCTGNVGENICQITNKHHFGLEVSFA